MKENDMIARIWRGTATRDKAESYRSHFTRNVAPHLKDIAGHRGAYLLRRAADGQVEFVAVTLWDSIETIKGFAGPNPEVAIVEPEARAVLSTFDEAARHYEVIFDGVFDPSVGSASAL
jgi:heme-degrading monooxygenase HmoA